MNESLIPFKNISKKGWLNLAIAATITFYIILSGFFIIKLDQCKNYGGDFCAYWSAGRIASKSGYANIYDLEILSKVQAGIYGLQDNPLFHAYGIMYLPIFLVPFQLFSFVKLPTSYALWNLVNLIIFIFYVRSFIKKIYDKPFPNQLYLLTIVSLPLYINIIEGQVNVWLVVCIGEFIKAIQNHRDINAGLWLGGLLLKPQILLLILPWLVFQRSKRVLLGFTIASLTVLFLSFILVGFDGFANYFNVLAYSGQGQLVSNPGAMVNWRMLGWHIATFSSSEVGTIVTILSSLVTGGVVLFKFRKRLPIDDKRFLIAIFGIFAATLAMTWHSHFHTTLILIPFILYFLNNNFPKNLYSIWVFIPVVIQFLLFVLTGLVLLGIPQSLVTQIVKFGEGIRGLVLNLALASWAIREYTKTTISPNSEKILH